MEVTWAPIAGVDMYGIGIATAATARPLVLATTANTSTIVPDLLPGVTYHLRLQWHSDCAPSIVAGWSYSSATVACSTASPPQPALSLTRTNPAHPSTIDLHLEPAAVRSTAIVAVVALGPRDPERYNRHLVDDAAVLLKHASLQRHAVPSNGHVALSDLKPGMSYWVAVGLDCTSHACLHWQLPSIQHTTAAIGDSVYTEMFRLSEYTFETDFLPNHNSADRVAMGAYIANGTPLATDTHWPGSTAQVGAEEGAPWPV